MVHIYATQNIAATQIANTPAKEASGDDPAVPAVEDAKVKGRYDVSGTVSYNMIPVKINGSLTTTENRSDLECSLSLPLSPTNPPTVRVKVSSVQGEGVDVPVQETEGLKEISYASLSQEETGSAFAEEIGESLNILLDSLKKQFPVVETQSGFDAPAFKFLRGREVVTCFGQQARVAKRRTERQSVGSPTALTGAQQTIVQVLGGVAAQSDVPGPEAVALNVNKTVVVVDG
jgi:hypothetical protein